MSRINLLTVGMTGVDMKSNPLFITQAKKLASATNVRFVEGTVVNRSGIKYVSLKQSGKLQGEATFRPARGISAGVFGEDVLLHVVVVDGIVYSGCDAVSGPVFKNAGDVFIYQAENYLIFQSSQTSTYWWDGVTFTESPGLNEQDWNDPDMPRIELPESAITAAAIDCDASNVESGINVRVIVIDSVTAQPVVGATWTVRRNGTVAYTGLTDANGRFTFNPVSRGYTYDIYKTDYTSIENVPLVITGTGVTRQWDTCFSPTISIVGEYDVGVVMTRSIELPGCNVNLFSFITVPNGAYDLSPIFSSPVITQAAAASSMWRLTSDSCGFYSIYAEGTFNSDGSIDVASTVRYSTNLKTETLAFESGFYYPEGVHLQVGCVVEGVTTWPERTCIPGYTNPYQE